jgi:hypothetical protein
VGTIRRLYRYLVAFISLEVVLWGLIELARSTVSSEIIGGSASQLARSLSLLLVGTPIFLLHWIPIQRSAAKDEQERSSLLRALFLYAALLATWFPIVQNVLALLARGWLLLFGLPLRHAIVGASQSWIDNLIAMLMNGLIAGYIFIVTRRNWDPSPTGQAFATLRRIYRYTWMLYGLAMLVGGLNQILQYLLSSGDIIGSSPEIQLANGLGLLLVGLPVWLISWIFVQRALENPAEQNSLLRQIILYVLKLIGMGGVLIASGVILHNIVAPLLGPGFVFRVFLDDTRIAFSSLLSLAGLWVYFGIILKRDLTVLTETQARTGLRRIYYYLLALIGLVSVWVGLHMLLSYLIDVSLPILTGESGLLGERLSAALSTLLVGLPLWMINWSSMAKETAHDGDAGDHARRSLVRKTYLYLILFAGVIGVMITAGGLVFELLKSVLGDPSSNLLRESLTMLEMLLLFTLFLAYHWQVMRHDNKLAESYLAALHAEYPVLVIAKQIGDYTENIINAIQRETETLPAAVFLTDNGAPDEILSEARAIILSGDLCINPPEALRLWLKEYSGERLVIPTPVEKWHWIDGSDPEMSKAARQAARIIRHLAEGEDLPQTSEISTGRIILYVLAGALGLPIIFAGLSMLLTFLFE